jgi:hydrogenase maturation protease
MKDPMVAGPVLVLGVGNELFHDEGLGCAASRAVAARLGELGAFADQIDVLDGATLGIALLPQITGRQALLILDAVVKEGARPGELIELHGDEVPANRNLTISAHQIGVGETLAAAQLLGGAPEILAAIGLVPLDLETGYGLSPTIEALIDAVADRALQVLNSWQPLLAHEPEAQDA